MVDTEDMADVIVVNTCCFIHDAKEESIQTILEMAEYKKEGGMQILRVYIDKEGGVDLDDCEKFSRALEEILDKDDPIEEAYSLEVSSPGLDRQLKKEREFLHYIGRQVEVKLYKETDGRKEFDGILKEYKDKKVYIETEGEVLEINPKDAAYIRLYFEF